MNIFERILDCLPFPLIVYLGALFLTAWLLRELYGYTNYKNVFRNRYFLICGITYTVILAGFYLIQSIKTSITKPSTPTETAETEHGEERTSILLKELKDKSLIQKLRDADAYLAATSLNSKEKSLKIYHDALNQLSPDAYRELDQPLLIRARSEDRNGHIDNALAKYREIFKEVLQYYDKNDWRR